MPRRGIELPDETWRLLKAHAAKRGQTLSALFRDMAADVVGGRAMGYPEPQAMREMTPDERAVSIAFLPGDTESPKEALRTIPGLSQADRDAILRRISKG